MKKFVFVILFMFALVLVNAASNANTAEKQGSSPQLTKVYVLGLKYDNGQLSKEYLFVTETMYENVRQAGPYEAAVMSSGKVRFKKTFSISTEVFDTEDTKGPFYYEVILPFYSDAQFITIKEKGKEKLKLSVSHFSEVISARGKVKTPPAAPTSSNPLIGQFVYFWNSLFKRS
ncbi:MAG: hypothetical protein V1722_03615 [Candidatus Micrarchaeota archaeon]